jgi:hypothetical protein
MNGLNFENNQSPKDIKIPRNTVNTTDTNRPMKGEAIKPDMPVRGWSFQVKVLNPNKLSTPIRIENGIMENRIPKATNLKIVSNVNLFTSISRFIFLPKIYINLHNLLLIQI